MVARWDESRFSAVQTYIRADLTGIIDTSALLTGHASGKTCLVEALLTVEGIHCFPSKLVQSYLCATRRSVAKYS